MKKLHNMIDLTSGDEIIQEHEINIEELLCRSVKIKAENRKEAIRVVKKMYDDEEIVLTADDFIGVKLNDLKG